MNRERPALVSRIRGDCVLALALLHHLVVTGNLSLEAICEMFATFAGRDLVLEFIPADDSMFRRLMKFRVDPLPDLSPQSVCNAFAGRFSLLKDEPIAHSQRRLLFLRKT